MKYKKTAPIDPWKEFCSALKTNTSATFLYLGAEQKKDFFFFLESKIEKFFPSSTEEKDITQKETEILGEALKSNSSLHALDLSFVNSSSTCSFDKTDTKNR